MHASGNTRVWCTGETHVYPVRLTTGGACLFLFCAEMLHACRISRSWGGWAVKRERKRGWADAPGQGVEAPSSTATPFGCSLVIRCGNCCFLFLSLSLLLLRLPLRVGVAFARYCCLCSLAFLLTLQVLLTPLLPLLLPRYRCFCCCGIEISSPHAVLLLLLLPLAIVAVPSDAAALLLPLLLLLILLPLVLSLLSLISPPLHPPPRFTGCLHPLMVTAVTMAMAHARNTAGRVLGQCRTRVPPVCGS